MARQKQTTHYIRGTATHRRTEGDYMGVLLDTVTLEDWRGIVAGAMQAAKDGDPSARAWLAQYLVGKPEHKAPTPLTVVVQQLSGVDSLVDKLTRETAHSMLFPEDDWKQSIRKNIEAELS
jgi:hypothetical protein